MFTSDSMSGMNMVLSKYNIHEHGIIKWAVQVCTTLFS